DITNYVMLETGHPVHAFDYDRIKTHTLILRLAKKGEVITTLDEKKYTLDNKDVIIDDGTGTIIDLPGIMGTLNSVVVNETRRIILFIESNNPVSIRRTSMKYGIRTMAATINEKNPDPGLVKTALLRGIKLYQDTSNAKIASVITDIYPRKPQIKSIEISSEFISKRTGINHSNKEISDILTSLQFQVESKNNHLIVTPPSFRATDVQIKEDLVEEVARIYGYFKLPGNLMTGKIPVQNPSMQFIFEDKIKIALKYLGFTETYSYSFISEKMIVDSKLKVQDHLEVSNPLTSDIQYMRISLFPSLLNTLCNNQYFTNRLRLFELANIYLPKKNDLPLEMPVLVMGASDNFFVIKGIIEALFKEFGLDKIEQKITSHQFTSPKQSISFVLKNTVLATVGILNSEIQSNFNIKTPLAISEINLLPLLQNTSNIKRYHPIPKQPSVIEDLALLIPENVKLGEVIKKMFLISPHITKINVIDIFENTTTLRINYQGDKQNLTSADTTRIRQDILSFLSSNYQIKLKSI
ncbi:phenylalanine--tRNA ligase subunit beta, partial [Candidatus Gottesmanbacteria bacterium]|nr:phenylalanine--tRNA ligase subunit beta [Candidatus Gottesmanbacteria bacterium]